MAVYIIAFVQSDRSAWVLTLYFIEAKKDCSCNRKRMRVNYKPTIHHRSVKCVRFLIARKKLRTNTFNSVKYGNFTSANCRIIFAISKRNNSSVQTLQSAVCSYTKIAGTACVTTIKLYCPQFDSCYVHTFFFAH